MAEALSIAPLVLELGKSMKSLSDFCQDVKKAPQEMQEFEEEVHAISGLLIQLESCGIIDAPEHLPAIQLCFEQCKTANKHISTVASELGKNMKAHRVLSSVSFALKKERLKKLTEKLERGKGSLSLACNIYGIWLAKSQAEAQHQLLLNVLSLVQTQGLTLMQISHGSPVVKSSVLTTTEKPNAGSGQECAKPSIVANTHGPLSTACFLHRVWEMLAITSMRGWKRRFNSYRVLPWDTPAFEMCRKGDLLGLQRTLISRKVALSDRSEYGSTLFMTAVASRQMHVARELKLMGADVTTPARSGYSPLETYWTLIRVSGIRHRDNVEEVRRDLLFFTEDCGLEANSGSVTLGIETFLKPTSTWTTKDRFNLVSCLEPNGSIILSTFWLLLDSAPYDSSLWQMETPRGGRIIHFVAAHFAYSWTIYSGVQQSWWALLTSAVDGGSDLHAAKQEIGLRIGTPMQTFLRHAIFYITQTDDNFTKLTDGLRSWVGALAAVGVRLLTYGRKEAALWRLGLDENVFGPRIISFVYGPNPEDWEVLTEHPGDRYVGVFWELVENHEKVVPGAWMEPSPIMWEDMYFERQQVIREKQKREGTSAL